MTVLVKDVNMPVWIIVVLSVLLTARLTRLVTSDMVTDWLRVLVAKKTGPTSVVSYFLSCAWCISVWVGVLVASIVVWWQDWSWWMLPLLAGAASHVTGLLTNLDGEDVEIVDE